jgi:alginate O-acetyltransferase complex protein AlgI
MDFREIFFFILAALIIRYFPVLKIRKWLLFVTSIGFVYWLQPLSPIRYLDFYLPTILFLLTLLSWFGITPPKIRFNNENLLAFAIALVSIFLINLTRWVSLSGIITASRPPSVSFFLVSIFALVFIFWLLRQKEAKNNQWLGIVLLIVFIVILIFLKNPTLNQWVWKANRRDAKPVVSS